MGCGSPGKILRPTQILNLPENSEPISTSGLKILPSTFVRANEHPFIHVYKIGASLGAGHTGEVCRCVHRDSKEERAVKVFRRRALGGNYPRGVRRSQEIEILRTVDHPNIVRVFEYFEEPKWIYLVMEYCKGLPLQQKIDARQQFSEENAAVILKQVFLVATYLHDKGIIHRDLKPENIILDEIDSSLQVKIVDFGAATFFDSRRPTHGSHGTLYYTAPEVLGEDYDEKCDVWSCGVVMYVLLCGKLPFEGTTDELVIEKIKAQAYSVTGGVWNSISQEAVELLKAVFTKANARISAKEALQHPWFAKHCPTSSLPKQVLADSLENIRAFHSATTLKDAVLTFITTQTLSAKDTRNMREVFAKIDTNGDGKISKEELITAYSELMDSREAKEIVDLIMREVDTDGSGFMDYTEFLKASMDQKQLLSIKNLERAFTLFDRDGSGTISTAEIRRVLASGTEADESIWASILSEADENGDGEIDVKEFEALVRAKF